MSPERVARKVARNEVGRRSAKASKGAGRRPVGRLALNSGLLRERLASVSDAARTLGIRPATVSSLLNGKTDLAHVRFGTILGLADLAGCRVDDLVIRRDAPGFERETFADSLRRWSQAAAGNQQIGGAEDQSGRSEPEQVAVFRQLPKAPVAEQPTFRDPNDL